MSNNEPPPYPGETPEEGPEQEVTPPPYGSTPPAYGEQPPPPPPGYGAPGGYQQPFSAPEAIGWAWRAFTRSPGMWIVVALITFVIGGALGFGSNLVVPSPAFEFDGTSTFQFDGAGLAREIAAQFVISVLAYVISVAVARIALDVAAGQTIDIGRAFSRVSIGQSLLAGLIVYLIIFVGLALCVLPGIVAIFFTYFVTYFVASGQTATDAVTSSFRLVAANIGDSLLLALLSVLVIIGGLLTLCVGLLVAFPIVTLAGAYAFERFQGRAVAG